MSTPVSPEELLQKGSAYFQAYQLDKALEIMNHLQLQLQLQQGAELSFHGQILWCNILLTKSRFSGNPSYAQIALHKLEELQQLLPSSFANGGSAPFILLFAQAHFQLHNFVKASQLIAQFLSTNKTADFFVGKAQAYTLLGAIAMTSFDIPKAIEFADKNQALLDKHSTNLSQQDLSATYDFLSTISLKQQAYTKAKEYAQKLESLGQETKLQEESIKGKLQLAQIAIEQQQYELAMLTLVQAKGLSKKIQHETLYAHIILHIGIVYTKVTSYNNALDNFASIQKEYSSLLQHPSYKHLYYTALGKALFYTNELANAETHFTLLVKSAENEAVKLTSRGITASKRLKDELSEIKGYQVMSNIFQKQKDYKNALLYQTIYSKFFEDFFARNDRQKIREIEQAALIQTLRDRVERLGKLI